MSASTHSIPSTITLPKGTLVHSMSDGSIRPLSRSQTVKPQGHSPSRVVQWDDAKHVPGTVLLPTVIWAGSGGYWKTAQITPAVAKANGIELELPELGKSSWRMMRSMYGVSPEDLSFDLNDAWTASI